MDEMIVITQDDVDTEKGSRSRLRVGTELSRAELLHLALMSSENRAAHALGRSAPGGLSTFVAQMNNKARELGMRDTRLSSNPRACRARTSRAPRIWPNWSTLPMPTPLRARISTSPHQVAVGDRTLQYNNTNRSGEESAWEIGLQKDRLHLGSGACLVMQATVAGRKLIMVFLDSAGKLSRLAMPSGYATGWSRWAGAAVLPRLADPIEAPARARPARGQAAVHADCWPCARIRAA
jgi:D-alanyl-D-alanine endopeptidase (penicillin-binding protein 7)